MSSDFYHKIQKALKNVGFYRVVFQRVCTPMGCLNVITIKLFLISKLKLFLEVLNYNYKDKGTSNELERYRKCW